ncbi:hypothetical protein JCM24511_05546 [Saitozyma sp. JCM 24511]|nr:hypothetical protein JCM24511_05546 [Saitozyma sp. JCM 24511]
MKVIVLGASGFIAFPIAQAFARAGHIVYGTTRSAENAKALARDEILPIVCDATNDEGRALWGKEAETADLIIDAIPSTTGAAPALATFKYASAISDGRPVGAKITYIYTAGAWTQSRGPAGLAAWTSDTQPHSGRVGLTTWRWGVEKEVLSSNAVNGIVIRPTLLYGKAGSLYSLFYFPAALAAAQKGETFEAVAHPDLRLANIHPDDLADLYLRVGERGPLLKGQTFVGSNQATERATDLLDAIVRVSGAKGYTIRPPSNAFEEAFCSSIVVKPSLGNALTGWAPKKPSLVDGIDVYWASFLAHQE